MDRFSDGQIPTMINEGEACTILVQNFESF